MQRRRLGHTGWRWVQGRARQLLRNPKKVQALLLDADLKPKQRLGAAREQLALLLRMLKAWLSGDYRQISPSTLLAAVGAVLYFVLPLDLIPDLILGVGFIDDIAVIAWVVNQIRDELNQFRDWEAARTETVVEAEGEAREHDST